MKNPQGIHLFYFFSTLLPTSLSFLFDRGNTQIITSLPVHKIWITCLVSDDRFNNSGFSTEPPLYTHLINRVIRFFKFLQVTGLQKIYTV